MRIDPIGTINSILSAMPIHEVSRVSRRPLYSEPFAAEEKPSYQKPLFVDSIAKAEMPFATLHIPPVALQSTLPPSERQALEMLIRQHRYQAALSHR